MLAATSGVLGTQGQQNPNNESSFGEVNLDDFLKLMITELQNQDPLDPMKNSEILQQISQIREIESNLHLTDTLESVFLGQNVSTAAGMIGDWIMKLSDDNVIQLIGKVDRVSIEDGIPRLSVEGRSIDMKGTPNLQVLSETIGQEMQEAMGLINKQIRGMTTASVQSQAREVVGRVFQISLERGNLQFHVKNDQTEEINIIEATEDNDIEVVTATTGLAAQ